MILRISTRALLYIQDDEAQKYPVVDWPTAKLHDPLLEHRIKCTRAEIDVILEIGF